MDKDKEKRMMLEGNTGTENSLHSEEGQERSYMFCRGTQCERSDDPEEGPQDSTRPRVSRRSSGHKLNEKPLADLRHASLGKLCNRLKEEIRERKRIEKELRRKELYFRNLIESMNNGLVIQDENGVITFVNDKLCNITGYSKEGFLGRSVEHILDMVDTPDRHVVMDQIARRKRGEAASYEIRGMTRDGRRLAVMVSPRPLYDDKGTYRGSFAVVTDITALKLAEEKVRSYGEQLHCLSSQLLTTQESERKRVSMELHDDLGQALVALKLSAKSIKMRLAPGEEEGLHGECLQLMMLADDILQKIQLVCRDLSPLILEDLGLSSALHMLLDDFSKRHGTQCIADVEDMDRLLDREAQVLIYRILQECLTNVAKHAMASRVLFLFRRRGEEVLFQVEDNGRGFPENQIRNERHTGKGLGLVAMAERVRMLGSNLEIKSTKGSTRIGFSFPLAGEGVK